jgi:hypothetical protein
VLTSSPDAEKTLAPANLPCPTALTAVFRMGSGFTPCGLAGGTVFQLLNFNFGVYAKGSIHEADCQVISEIRSPARCRAGASSGSEAKEVVKDITEA